MASLQTKELTMTRIRKTVAAEWRPLLLALIAVVMVVGVALSGPVKKVGNAEYHNLFYDCAGVWLAFI